MADDPFQNLPPEDSELRPNAEAGRLLLGGPVVGEATLVRFYVLHVAVLPVSIVMLLTFHLWRWRKDAMLETPGDEPSE